jgi:hypothetical protein
MHMILDAADVKEQAFLPAHDAADVRIDPRGNRLADPRLAPLRREHDVIQQL